MDMFITVLLDGLVFSGYLFIVSLGLTIIFGVMKLLNFAHGSCYQLGAYTAAFFITKYGVSDAPISYFLLIVAAALVVGIILGVIIERGVLHFLHDRDEVLVVLATFGIFLILEDVTQLLFKGMTFYAFAPAAALGTTEIGGLLRDNYSLSLIAVALGLAAVCWIGFSRTKWGKLLQVVIYNREISLAMGIDVARVSLVTFSLGCVLGALGGSYVSPLISVAPGLGAEVVVLSFAVVVIGGMGSIPGALIGALAVGMSRAIATHTMQEMDLVLVYAVMVAVLIFRPEGLFPPLKARRI
jgi:branched-chain amino acid transport system permease protein